MNEENEVNQEEQRKFLREVIEYILCTVSREELDFLLNEVNVWETLVTEAHLTREEADALREGLNKLKKAKSISSEDTYKKDQECRERFLQAFPQVKIQLESHIAQLRELADKLDKVHRDCTISSMVAHTTGIVSGVMTIAGLKMAPFTAGISLVLTATGLGLGAAAAVTTVTASIVEHVNKTSVEAEANHLKSTDFNILQLAKDIISHNTPDIGFLKDSIMSVYRIAKHIRAIRLVQINPTVAAEILFQSGRLVEGTVGTSRQLVGKGAQFFSGATTGFFLLLDVVSLMQNSKDLQEGAKTESAEKLRLQAQELEMMLEKLNTIQGSLLTPPTEMQETEMCGGLSCGVTSPEDERGRDEGYGPG